jgi:hypothetical protein
MLSYDQVLRGLERCSPVGPSGDWRGVGAISVALQAGRQAGSSAVHLDQQPGRSSGAMRSHQL